MQLYEFSLGLVKDMDLADTADERKDVLLAGTLVLLSSVAGISSYTCTGLTPARSSIQVRPGLRFASACRP